MKATITSLELKNPLKFFALSYSAMHIIRQIRTTDCKEIKTQGVWTRHYTMTLWESEEQLQAFARSGAHLEAMKKSAEIAKEIRTITINAEKLPNWREAKEWLKKAKVIRYD